MEHIEIARCSQLGHSFDGCSLITADNSNLQLGTEGCIAVSYLPLLGAAVCRHFQKWSVPTSDFHDSNRICHCPLYEFPFLLGNPLLSQKSQFSDRLRRVSVDIQTC